MPADPPPPPNVASLADGAEASRRIACWLAEREARTPPAVAPVLERFAERLRDLLRHEVVAADPACMALVAEMGRAPHLDALVASVDALAARVAERLAEPSARNAPLGQVALSQAALSQAALAPPPMAAAAPRLKLHL